MLLKQRSTLPKQPDKSTHIVSPCGIAECIQGDALGAFDEIVQNRSCHGHETLQKLSTESVNVRTSREANTGILRGTRLRNELQLAAVPRPHQRKMQLLKH
ncbi:hypothetical protein XI06_05470 [Bradyrhizobium sp. CCBAU 11434]|nr:hypothetical protein [Bradyrhizobium sp. CCBAU 11434]